MEYKPYIISEAFHWILTDIYNKWDFLLQDFDSGHLISERLAVFAAAVHQKGAPLRNCWGSTDCTIRNISRPVLWQRTVYSGHKKQHSLKYSAVKCPDGLIYHLFGPCDRRRNDNYLLNESNLKQRCLNNVPQFCLYGDPTYSVSTVLQSPFNSLKMNDEEKKFNKVMSSCRECVEWGFGDIIKLWSYLDYSKGQQLLVSPLGIQYRVATLLTNIHICLYGSNTSAYFNCCPPSL